jgi:rRNA maturation RNase YbeY
MIIYNSENNFELYNENQLSKWIEFSIHQENKELGELNYIFCDDDYLLEINIKQLKHNELTDIISFDYSEGKHLAGDIFISIDRIEENAKKFKIPFEKELQRVLIHGILHFAGFKDKTTTEKEEMRKQENLFLKIFSN